MNEQTTSTGTTNDSAWSPLRLPLFRAIWIATIVSNVGTWMHDVGAAWLMTTLSSSPLMVALVQSATQLPVFLLALPAGALADIIDRRKYLIATQLYVSLCAGTLGVLTVTGTVSAPLLLMLTFAMGVGTALTVPAMASVTPEIVPRAMLHNAIALRSMAMNASRALGPAIAGVIVASAGPAAVFFLNAVSFFGVMWVIFSWRRVRDPSPLPAERLFGAIRTGLRFLRHAPALQSVLARGVLFFLFASAATALLPLVARTQLQGGAHTYGMLLGCIGAGAVAGALALPRLRRRVHRDLLVTVATVLYAAGTLALGLVRDVRVLGLILLFAGAGWLTVMSSLQLATQTALPNWVRARGLSTFVMAFTGSMAGGSALWGMVATHIGLPHTLILAGAGALAVVPLGWRFRVGSHDHADLTATQYWPAPIVAAHPGFERGPVLVAIDYSVDPRNAEEFLYIMRNDIRRIRRRDGAFFWEIFEDVAAPGRYTEQFMVDSWAEHLRQHTRVTVADRAALDRILAFHQGPGAPQVNHLLVAP